MNAVTHTESLARRIEAAYAPDDDKIRLRCSMRLDSETYARVKAAGFGWAPKQECFYAVWRPDREDLAMELAGEIGDEDTTLVERAEDRAERFEEYSEKREADAHRAHEAIASIADNIPLGQPILVGHHSEKRARKDAERIENGMRKAVKLWSTAQYWERRAKGAIRAAKYKETPAVRHRRIKVLEADMRKQVKTREQAMAFSKAIQTDAMTPERVRAIFNVGGGSVDAWYKLDRAIVEGAPNLDEVVRTMIAEAVARHTRTIEHCERWISHLTNRLAYERAMLDDGGGIVASKFDLAIGGRVLIRNEWAVIVRLNRQGGKDSPIVSVSVKGLRFNYGAIGVEKISDYRAPDPEAAGLRRTKGRTHGT